MHEEQDHGAQSFGVAQKPVRSCSSSAHKHQHSSNDQTFVFVLFHRPASEMSCIHVQTRLPLKASNLQNFTLAVFQSAPNGESQSCHFLTCLNFPACPPIGESQIGQIMLA